MIKAEFEQLWLEQQRLVVLTWLQTDSVKTGVAAGIYQYMKTLHFNEEFAADVANKLGDGLLTGLMDLMEKEFLEKYEQTKESQTPTTDVVGDVAQSGED